MPALGQINVKLVGMTVSIENDNSFIKDILDGWD